MLAHANGHGESTEAEPRLFVRRCESWNWWAIVCQWISGFIMCTNAMMVVVGSATYLSVNRPESRSSVVRNTNPRIHLLTF